MEQELRFTFAEAAERLILSDQPDLFRLIIDRGDAPGERVVLTSQDFAAPTASKEDNTTTLTYRSLSVDIIVMVHLMVSDYEVVAWIELEVAGELSVRQVQFPVVQWYDLSPIDRLLVASSWGDDIPQPTKTIREFCLQKKPLLGQTYIEYGEDEVIYRYPSILAMQFMVLHNPARSLYLSAYSADDETRTLNAKVLPKRKPDQAAGLDLSVNHYPFLSQGSWHSPQCGLALCSGDWHGAADLYASHMRSRFHAPDLAAWMRQGFHGWAQINMHTGHSTYYFRDLLPLYEQLQPTGINVLQVAGWCGWRFDTLYPDYDPNPELGTAEELRAAIGEIQARGGKVILYTNGRLVDPDSHFYRQGGEHEICVDEQGKPYVEEYGPDLPKFYVACPSSALYRNYLTEQVRKIYTDLGPAAIQIDQISCNLDYFCFDRTHDHPTPATNFLPGLDQELKQIRAVQKQVQPEGFIWCEGAHERFGQFYDINQGHGEDYTWQIGDLVPELFSYVYPERIVTGMCADLQQLCYSFAQGKPLDFPFAHLQDDAFRTLLTQLVAVRKALPAYFLRGRFRDSVGLQVYGALRVFGIERDDNGGLLVNLWLPGASPAHESRAMLINPRPQALVALHYPQQGTMSHSHDLLELRWRGPLATLVFEQP